MRRAALTLVLALALFAAPAGSSRHRAGAGTQSPAPPQLLVLLVVDQLRFDYLDRHARLWTAGLKRLLTEGAVFERAFYPYLNTVTCTGHATIGTGTFPYEHGVILNEWYRRDEGRRRPCTFDSAVESVPYSPPAEPVGHSARQLRVPTLGERLREQSSDARVVVLSMKPRSTVMLAGNGGTAVTWFGDTNTWATSSVYTPQPLAPVAQFLAANPLERMRYTVWDRLRPDRAYTGQDQSAYERPPRGWTSTFPHPLAGAPGTSHAEFFNLWERSPFSDEYLGRMAATLVDAYALGRRETVDLLGVSFSGLDYVGHDFGPDSHEVQDTLVRLDVTLGALLDHLDRVVGEGRYAVALSADHGVSAIPEARRADGGDAGRVLNGQVQKVAEAAMQAAYGAGHYVAHVEYTNLYLAPEARERMIANPAYVQPVIDAVSRMPGVLRVFAARGLESQRTSTDPVVRAAAYSHHPEESGDLLVVLKPEWIGTNTSAATHGSGHAYDQHVPVIFFGAAFTAGRYSTAATPADLAPTLASLVGLTLPDADGTVRREALR